MYPQLLQTHVGMIVISCFVGDLFSEPKIYIKILILKKNGKGQLDSLKLAFYNSVI